MALLAIRLVLVFLAGTCLGSFVNWAIYTLAWSPRPISPWVRGPQGSAPRRFSDRVPIFGWLALRRESSFFGPRFWWRPIIVEIVVGVALAALYWWEVGRLGLIRDQLRGIAIAPPLWSLHWQFVSHTILFCWMLAASFIDIDEKIIPDEITVTGTLLGLILAAAVPLSLLPHVSERPPANRFGAAPVVALVQSNGGPAIGPNGNQFFLEPVTPVAPSEWPPTWGVPRTWTSLAVGLGCYWLWCFALAPRIWRGRRGPLFAVRLIAGRLCREFTRPPLSVFFIAGSVAILCVWWLGEARWAGLLTALIGLVSGGGIVWAVRLVGHWALRKEAMGFGDVTLLMMIGSFVGWQACIFAFFLAPFTGLIVGIIQFVLKRDDVIPYGPFLCLGSSAVIVGWGRIWQRTQVYFELMVLDAFPPGLIQAPNLEWLLSKTPLVPFALVVCLILLGWMLWMWRLLKEALFGAPS